MLKKIHTHNLFDSIRLDSFDTQLPDELQRPTINPSDWRVGRITDVVFTQMVQKAVLPEYITKIFSFGSIYLLFEIVKCTEAVSTPVWKFLNETQLSLQNDVYNRKKNPRHLECLYFADQVLYIYIYI